MRFLPNRLPSRYHSESGQIGIIIILIMLVLLTFGLSIAARSTKEIALTQQEEESNRVFNGAEAGAEQALATNLNFTGTVASGSVTRPESTTNYTISKNTVLETRIPEGGTALVQLPGTAAITLYIDFSKETDCSSTTNPPASLIAAMYYQNPGGNNGEYVHFYPYAACDRGDGITVSPAGSNGYFKRATLAIGGGSGKFVRLKALYGDTNVRVSASAALPTQMYDIRSESLNTRGKEARAVEVNRSLDVAPSIMDYAVFSGGSLVK